MVRHPTARRTHRQPDTDADDVFVERVLEATAWARQYRTPLIAGLLVLAIVAAGLLIYRSNSERLNTRAAIEILQVRQSAQLGNPAVTIRDAETFLQTFGRTPSATEARLILAQAYLEQNQPDPAIQALDGVSDNLSSPSGVSAAMLQAAAHEAAARYEEAEGVLQRVANGARFDYQKVAALDNLARIRLERGNAAGAVEAYDRLLRELPDDSQDRPIFQMRRAEAQTAANRSST